MPSIAITSIYYIDETMMLVMVVSKIIPRYVFGKEL